jgi:hypothetical protein
MTKTTKLSPKEKKYTQAILEGKTKVEAGLVAGAKTPQAASKYADRMSKNVQIQGVIADKLAELDITPGTIIQVYADAIQAVKVVIIGNGEDAFADVQPDHNTRMRAAEKLSELLGMKHTHKPDEPIAPSPSQYSIPPELLNSADEVELNRAIFRRSA